MLLIENLWTVSCSYWLSNHGAIIGIFRASGNAGRERLLAAFAETEEGSPLRG
jgi:hypothetical protein